jgi:hypothetical protein
VAAAERLSIYTHESKGQENFFSLRLELPAALVQCGCFVMRELLFLFTKGWGKLFDRDKRLDLAGALYETLFLDWDTHCSTGHGAVVVDPAATVRLQRWARHLREFRDELVNDCIVPFVEQVRILEARATGFHRANLLSGLSLDVLSLLER